MVRKGWRERDRDVAMRLSLSFPKRQPSAQYGRPHQPSDLLTNEWERCQSVPAQRERRSSLLPGIIALRCGGTTLASEEGRRGWGGWWGAGVREAMLGMMGNQTPSVAVAMGSA